MWANALREGGTLNQVAFDEHCVVVVPSSRVSPDRFETVLNENRVPYRLVGRGSGPVIDGGAVIDAIHILAVPSVYFRVLYLLSRLCAVTLLPIQRDYGKKEET
jgi:hypothetical protein